MKRYFCFLSTIFFVSALSFGVSIASATDVLFVTGQAGLNKGEKLIKTRLVSKGINVVTKRDQKATLKLAAKKDLLLLSNTVHSKILKSRFRKLSAPIICLQPSQYPALGMSKAKNASGVLQKQKNVIIKDSTHPLAASLSGAVAISTKNVNVGWGAPAKSAARVVTVKGSSSRFAVFGYETGASMVGLKAPAKRVGFFVATESAGALSESAWQLFDAAVSWALLPVIPATPAGQRTLVFYNNGSTTIWVGASGDVPNCAQCADKTRLTGEITGFELAPAEYKIFTVANNLQSANFWARTGCTWKSDSSWPTSRFVCETGDCGSDSTGFGVQCNGGTKQPPANSFEITMDPSTGYINIYEDYYDLTNVDGYVMGIKVAPLQGRYTMVNPWTKDAKYNCGTAVDATFDMNKCPEELLMTGTGGQKACWSLCKAMSDPTQRSKFTLLQNLYNDTDTRAKVCCACDCGAGCGCESPSCKYGCSPYALPLSSWGLCYVETWPTPSAAWCAEKGFSSCTYPSVFKTQCPDAYSWQFNDGESTFQCRDADYMITFSP